MDISDDEDVPAPPAIERGFSTCSNFSEGDWGDDAWDDAAGDDDDDDELLGAGEKYVSAESAARVEADLAEVGIIAKYDGVKFLSNCVKLKLGILLDELHWLDKNQRDAWALGDARYIFVLVEFGPYYLTEAERPKVTIGKGNKLGFDEPVMPFLLSWTLQQRIKSKFFNPWPVDQERFKNDVDIKEVIELMETAQVDYFMAVEALRRKKSVSAAIMALVDEAEKKIITKLVTQHHQKVEAEAAKAASSPAGFFSSFFSRKGKSPSSPKVGVRTSNPDAQSLVAMFNISPVAADVAIELWETVEHAVQELSVPSKRQEILVIAAQREKVLAESQSSGVPKSFDSRVEQALSKHNLLVQLLNFTEDALSRVNAYCMICEKELDYSGVKPTVCTNPACLFSYQDMGLGFDLAVELRNNPEIIDLLITFAYSAGVLQRIHLCYPEAVRSKRPPITSLLDDQGKPNVAEFNRVMKLCPSVADMRQMADKGILESELNKLDPRLYPLLQWIVTSNRAHLRKLDPDEMMDVGTDYQFVFVSQSPEKEAQFQRQRERVAAKRGKGKGTIRTWHGSPFGNWHSILRNGLKNYSGTKNQLHGAAYGSGVYMAKDSQTSHGYCRPSGKDGWEKSMFGMGVRCLALCEVVNDPNLKPPKPFYVVPNEEWISTRFFLVYSSKGTGSRNFGKNIQAMDVKLPNCFGHNLSS